MKPSKTRYNPEKPFSTRVKPAGILEKGAQKSFVACSNGIVRRRRWSLQWETRLERATSTSFVWVYVFSFFSIVRRRPQNGAKYPKKKIGKKSLHWDPISTHWTRWWNRTSIWYRLLICCQHLRVWEKIRPKWVTSSTASEKARYTQTTKKKTQ